MIWNDPGSKHLLMGAVLFRSREWITFWYKSLEPVEFRPAEGARLIRDADTGALLRLPHREGSALRVADHCTGRGAVHTPGSFRCRRRSVPPLLRVENRSRGDYIPPSSAERPYVEGTETPFSLR